MLHAVCTLAADRNWPVSRKPFQFLQELARCCIRFDFRQREKDQVRLYSFTERLQV